MATQILSSGTDGASTADINLADGVSTSIIVRGAGRAYIEAKASDNSYWKMQGGELGVKGSRVLTVTGPLVFRVTRVPGVALAIDRE
jgi:hypothetical protein